ncbi:MAG TPA: hypothetical protein VN782_05935 [Usitatibacter sp.]|nr:hypothetical protein [Usitatibacter sp.]
MSVIAGANVVVRFFRSRETASVILPGSSSDNPGQYGAPGFSDGPVRIAVSGA